MTKQTTMMARTWEAIEEHFPPAGVRSRMIALLGEAPLAALESAGAVVLGQIASNFPCTTPCPENCPMEVLDNGDGTYTAFCPIEPDEQVLSEQEARLQCLDRDGFTKMLQKVLGITGRREWLAGLPNVCRLGAHVPVPGMRFPIFFVARCSSADYARDFDVLLAQERGPPFAVVLLTRRHVTHDIGRKLSDAGAVLVALSDVLDFQDGRLRLLVEPGQLFERLGQVPPSRAGKAPVVARAIIGLAGRFSWRDLDQDAYDGLLAQRAQYDIVADELTRTCFKKGKTAERINPAYFATIRAAMERRSKYDPDQNGPEDAMSGKQTFQRARQTFDIGKRKSWKLFKTDMSDEVTRYDFSPDADVSFVFIFAPKQ